MALGGGMSCVKYLLFCFNLLFVITGLIILTTGAMAQSMLHPYTGLTNEAFYTSAPMILIIIGVIVFIVAFFGCCGAVKENHCMITTFTVFLLIIFVCELAVGIAGYVKRDALQTSIERSLNETIANYPTNKKTIDRLETDLTCCGINGPADWDSLNIPIPDSCCTGQEIKPNGTIEPCSTTNPNFHNDGCMPKLVTLFKRVSLWLGGVGLGIAVVQLLGVIFACCLARSIRSQYETV